MPLRHLSKTAFAYQSLREEILAARLAPGSRIVLEETARRLGLSPIPLREALRQLESERFVAARPRGGWSVTAVGAGDIAEVFALLEALEVVAGRLACERLSDADLAQLGAEVAGMAHLTRDPVAWSDANATFHCALCERAGAGLTALVLARVEDHWRRLHRLHFARAAAGRIAQAQREHAEILDALRARDSARVEALIRQHNRAALEACRRESVRANRTAPKERSRKTTP